MAIVLTSVFLLLSIVTLTFELQIYRVHPLILDNICAKYGQNYKVISTFVSYDLKELWPLIYKKISSHLGHLG